MKKIKFYLLAVLAMIFGIQSGFAQTEITPEANVYYSLVSKWHLDKKGEYRALSPQIGNTTKQACAEEIVKSNKDGHSLTFVPTTDGSYHIVNKNGDYLYYEQYHMYFAAYDASKEAGNNGYTFTLQEVESDNPDVTLCRLHAPKRGTCPATDSPSNDYYWVHMGCTDSRGVFELVKSEDLKYEIGLKFEEESIGVEAGEGENGTGLGVANFSVSNFEGPITITFDDDGFSATPSSLELEDGGVYNLNITSDASKQIGDNTIMRFKNNGNEIASVKVEVVKPQPRYYLVNIESGESGLVIGGTGNPVLEELADDENQLFRKVLVKGTTDTYYLIQESTGLYLKNVDSGEGYGAHYTEYGGTNKAKWKFPSHERGFYQMKNINQDRILKPDALAINERLACYGLASDAGTQWELIEATDAIRNRQPAIEITDKDVIVEKNGLTFTTKVRGLFLNGRNIELRPSAGVTVSVASISEGFNYTNVIIGTSNDAGTACRIEFLSDGTVVETLNFTVSNKFDRFIIRAADTKEGDPNYTGVYALASTDGSDGTTPEPLVKEFDVKDPLQHFIFVPVDGMENTYFLVQDGTFLYFAKSEVNDWTSTMAPSPQRYWIIEDAPEKPDTITIKNQFNNKYLGANPPYEDKKVYTSQGGGRYWTLVPVGSMEVDLSSIVLADKDDTKKVTIKTSNLQGEITVTASEGFNVDKATLPATGGDITISSTDGSVLSGTVTLTCGDYTETIRVRMKNTQLNVSEESLQITGKGASASFLVQGSDWETAITITASEGFSVNVSSIEPAASINQSITVSYAGQVNANGTVTVESGSFKKEIPVTATIDSKITVSAKELEFEEGFAVFTVTAKDLFEDIIITSSSTEISVDPGTLDANVVEGFVFVQYNGTGEAPGVNITLTSGNITETVKVNGGSTGIGDTVGDAIQISVKGDQLYVNGLPAGAKVMVTDILGKSVIADSLPYTISNQGVYIISILDGQKSIKMQKIIR